MSHHLELILDDLRAGLRHRAAMRRRRARAAGATVTTAMALALAFLVSAPLIRAPAPSGPGDGTLTARLLSGEGCPDGIACFPVPTKGSLNLPKEPKE